MRRAALLLLAMVAAPPAFAGSDRILYSFTGGPDGYFPNAPLLFANNVLYGTTVFGGAPYNLGTLFQLTLSGTETVLVRFPGGIYGSSPQGNLTDLSGTLYGIITDGATTGEGTAYGLYPPGPEQPLNVFDSGSTDNITPTTGFTKLDGALYGIGSGPTAPTGGIYKITTDGKHHLLATFPANTFPNSLTAYNGMIYGTADIFAAGNTYGELFAMDKAGHLTTLYTFAGPAVEYPTSPLLAHDGLFYGTAQGLFYSLTQTGTVTPIGTLSGCGGEVYGPLAMIAGKFYGTFTNGGNHNDGGIAEIRPDGTCRIAHSFGHPGDGITPNAGLIAVRQTLYGTTQAGGTWNLGAVYAFTPGG